MRLAADRIVASLERLDYADTPVWEAAQQLMLERLQRLAGPLPAGSSGDAPSAHAGASPQASLSERLRAAAAAAAAALPPLPLEAEGRMYEEPRPQRKVSRPADLMDVSDLDPGLTRRARRMGFACAVCEYHGMNKTMAAQWSKDGHCIAGAGRGG